MLTEVDIQQTLKNKLGVHFRRYEIAGAVRGKLERVVDHLS